MIPEAITQNIKKALSPDATSIRDVNVNVSERILSVIGGAYLAYKSIENFREHPFISIQEAVAAGLLLYRGASGFCPAYALFDKNSTRSGAVHITGKFIVDRPRPEVYAFWRRLENLPRFMKHLASVEEYDRTRSHWRANLPGEIVKLSWNAEIVEEDQNNYIGWRSLEGSMVDNAGKVTFHDAIEGTGTELTVDIRYYPPAGSLGQGVARLLNGLFENMVREDVANFASYVEGEEYKTYEHDPKDHTDEDAVNRFK